MRTLSNSRAGEDKNYDVEDGFESSNFIKKAATWEDLRHRLFDVYGRSIAALFDNDGEGVMDIDKAEYVA